MSSDDEEIPDTEDVSASFVTASAPPTQQPVFASLGDSQWIGESEALSNSMAQDAERVHSKSIESATGRSEKYDQATLLPEPSLLAASTASGAASALASELPYSRTDSSVPAQPLPSFTERSSAIPALSVSAAFLPPASPGGSPHTSPERVQRRKQPKVTSTHTQGKPASLQHANNIEDTAGGQSTFEGSRLHHVTPDLSPTKNVLPGKDVEPLSTSMMSDVSNAGPVTVVDDIVSSSDGSSSQSPGSPLFMRLNSVDALLANADELITDARTMVSSQNRAAVEKYRGDGDVHLEQPQQRFSPSLNFRFQEKEELSQAGSDNSGKSKNIGFLAGLSASISSTINGSGSVKSGLLDFSGRISRSSSGLSNSGSTGPLLDLNGGTPSTSPSPQSSQLRKKDIVLEPAPANPYFERVLSLGSGKDDEPDDGFFDYGDGKDRDLLGMNEPQPGLSASSIPETQQFRTSNNLAETLGGPMLSDIQNSTKSGSVQHDITAMSATRHSNLLGLSLVLEDASLAEEDPFSDFRILCDNAAESVANIGIIDGMASSMASVTGIGMKDKGFTSAASRAGPTQERPSLHGHDIDNLGDRPYVSLEIRLRQDVPASMLEGAIQTLFLSKGMTTFNRQQNGYGDTIIMKALEPGSKARKVSVIFGVSSAVKYRVACITVHGTDGSLGKTLGEQMANTDSSRQRGSGSLSGTLTGAIGGIVQGASDIFDGVVGSPAIAESRKVKTTVNVLSDRIDIASALGRGGGRRNADPFVLSLFESLKISFIDQGLILSALSMGKDFRQLSAPLGIEKEHSLVDETLLGREDRKRKSCVLAQAYLRQLRQAFYLDMMRELRIFAEPLDKYVLDAEWSCAQFISAIRPTFRKYGIDMIQMPPMPRLKKNPASDTHEEVTSIYSSKNSSSTVSRTTHRKIMNSSSPLHESWEKRALWSGSSPGKELWSDSVLRLDQMAHEAFAKEFKHEADSCMQQKHAHISERINRCNSYKENVLYTLCTSKFAMETELTKRFAALFGVAGEVVIIAQNATLGSRPGKLWLTFEHLCFHSSILGFVKKKVYSISDVQSVCKKNGTGLIGVQQSLNILTGTHGEISFTVTNAANIFTVIDHILTMRGDESISRGILSLKMQSSRGFNGSNMTTSRVGNAQLSTSFVDSTDDLSESGIPEGEEQTAQWL